MSERQPSPPLTYAEMGIYRKLLASAGFSEFTINKKTFIGKRKKYFPFARPIIYALVVQKTSKDIKLKTGAVEFFEIWEFCQSLHARLGFDFSVEVIADWRAEDISLEWLM